MKRDGVSIAFDLVREEIAAVEAQLKHEGAAAFQSGRYADAERLSEAGKQLEHFTKKLTVLKEEWKSGIDISTRNRVRVDPSYHPQTHKKGPRQNLRITLPNGRVIQRATAASTMVDAIEALGVERVMKLGHKVCGVPLVGTVRDERYGQKPLGEFLVCTHSNTANKKALLERLGQEVGSVLNVEIIP